MNADDVLATLVHVIVDPYLQEKKTIDAAGAMGLAAEDVKIDGERCGR
jgi:hypothetical protein